MHVGITGDALEADGVVGESDKFGGEDGTVLVLECSDNVNEFG